MKLTVSIDVPRKLKLQLKEDKIVAKGANRIAKVVRDRIRSGNDANGSMPPDGKGGKRLHKTGELIKSIKYRRGGARNRNTGGVKEGLILPVGTHSGGSRNMTILATQIHRSGYSIDPLGVDDALEREYVEHANKEIQRQLQTGESKLEMQGTVRIKR